MSELVEFIEARLAEDEKDARNAGSNEPHWIVTEDHGGDYTKPLEYRVETKPYPHQFTARREPFSERVAVLADAGALNLESAWASRHIARHDPARVLAEVAAKRRIVEEHPEGGGTSVLTGERLYDGRCARCADQDGTGYGDFGVPWPCPTLRALASVYADHAEFREEWGV